MSLESDVRCLGSVQPLAELPREALQILAFSCEKLTFPSGATLFRTGEPAEGAFVVLEGEVMLRGQDQRRRVGPGTLIGAVALLTETRQAADAEATQETSTLHIPRETFRRVLTEFPDAAARIREATLARTQSLLRELDALRRRNFAPRRSQA